MKRASAKSATQHSALALCWPWATGVLRRIPCKPGGVPEMYSYLQDAEQPTPNHFTLTKFSIITRRDHHPLKRKKADAGSGDRRASP